MSKKIKVMNQKPEASDEEIQSYMNFEGLMEKRAEALSSSARSSLIKKGIGGLLILSIAVSLVWFFQKSEQKNAEQSAEQNTFPSQPLTQSAPAIDSSTEEEQNDQAEEAIVHKQQSKKELLELKPGSESTSPQEKKNDEEQSYVQAEPVKGYPGLYEYFNKNLIYPKDALNDSIQGVLTIAFVINRNGRPEKIEIVNSPGESFDREARRLVESMPDWKPAMLNGKPVPSRMTLPITFQIVRRKAD